MACCCLPPGLSLSSLDCHHDSLCTACFCSHGDSQCYPVKIPVFFLALRGAPMVLSLCSLCLACQCCEIQVPAVTPLERPHSERLFSVHRQDCSVNLHIDLEQRFPKCGLRTLQGPLRAFQGTCRVKTIFIIRQRHSLCNIMRTLVFWFLCHSKVYCSVF